MPATGAMAELLLGGTWTDITSRVYLRDRITITRGRQDQGARVDPGSCTLTLNNKGGYFSPRNPLSPLYGQIGRGTQLRVSAVGGTPWLGLPASGPARVRASTPDAPALDITGDIDLRFDVQPDDWNGSNVVTLAGKWGAAGQRSYRALLVGGFASIQWSPDGTAVLSNGVAFNSNSRTPRMCLRMTLDVDNGAGGKTAAFYTGPTLAGPWTQLDLDQVSAGTTSIFASTAPLEFGDTSVSALTYDAARLYGGQVRNGIGGTLVASPDFTAQAVGATSLTDSTGRVWTVTAGGITNRRVRFLGEVSSWPARWDVSGGDVYVPIQAAGIMRRLGQGASPLDSTLRRRIASWPTTVAYWPFEDGQGATQAYSPTAGVQAAPVTGAQPASDDSLAGSLALPVWPQGSAFTCTVPTYAASTQWQVQCVFRVDSSPATMTNLLIIQTTGTIRRWEIAIAVGGMRVRGLDSTGTLVIDSPWTLEVAGPWTRLQFRCVQSGGTVTWHAGFLIVGAVGLDASGTVAGTSGQVSDVHQTYIAGLDNLRLGHVGVFSDSEATAFNFADTGFDAESAAPRFVRLAAEEGLPFVVPYGIVGTAPLGPQRAGALLDLMEEAADADVGVLYEARTSIALAFRTRQSLYNQTPALALNYAARGEVAPPLEPVEDDTTTRNDVTRSRPSGSSARLTLDTGALSTAAPPLGVGRYQDAQDVNVHTDDQLVHAAGWALHLGTVDEARYPAVTVNLAAGPWLTAPACETDTGDLISIANPPPWLPPGTIVLMAQGYAEVIGVYDWTITYNCSPGSPWSVGVLDDGVLGRLDTAGSSVAAGVTAAATALSVATTAGPLWTAAPADAPWDVRVAGEVLRVEAVGTTILNAGPWMDTDAAAWSAMGTTATVAWLPVARPDGAAGALQITPNGVATSGGAIAVDRTAVGSIVPAASYTVCLWAYSPGGWSDLRPAVDWYNAAGTFLSSSLGSAFVVPAGVWTFLSQTLVAPASASTAQVRARHGGTPAASNTWFAWGIRIMAPAGVQTSPQAMAVTRSRNGIAKAQLTGADVRLATPLILAL